MTGKPAPWARAGGGEGALPGQGGVSDVITVAQGDRVWDGGLRPWCPSATRTTVSVGDSC